MSLTSLVRVSVVVALAVSSAGFGACKKGNDDDADKRNAPKLPASAVTVSAPTVGIATGTPVIVPSPIPGVPSGAPATFAPLVRTAGPAVVTIVTNTVNKKGRKVKLGLGSGFLVDKAGTIITNNHVVHGGNAIEVIINDEKTVDGSVVGTDPMTDVAVVKIAPPDGVAPLPLGDSDAVAIGDWLVAIGNPLGLAHTVTAGILSARGRTTKDVPLKPMGGGEGYFDLLQTDCAINPGNSGGPLLNLRGEVIGINTAIINTKIGQGLAFAIPINMVKLMLPSLMKEGHLVRSYLGVGVEDAPKDESGMKGAIVNHVYKATPAEKAGLAEGDRVLAVNGQTVRDAAQLRWLVSIAGVGRKSTLRILRGEKAFDLDVTLEQLPDKPPVSAPQDDDEENGEE